VPLVAAEVAATTDRAPLIRATDRNGDSLLLATRAKPPRVIELPADGPSGEIARYPASEACREPYVLLRERVKPTESAFPEITARLAFLEDIELVTETRQQGTDLGLVTPSMDVAKRAIALLKGAARVAPKIFCHRPRIKRRIVIEKPEED
jgi:hypothetical protein